MEGMEVVKITPETIFCPHSSDDGIDDVRRVEGIVSNHLRLDKKMPIPIRIFKAVHEQPLVAQKVPQSFFVCRESKGTVIAAGVCVSQMVNKYTRVSEAPFLDDLGDAAPKWTSSDLDLYPRANSREEALSIVKHLCEILKPVGEVTMSKYAISMDVPKRVLYPPSPSSSMTTDDSSGPVACHVAKYYKPTKKDEEKEEKDIDDNEIVYRVQIIAQPIPNTGDLCRDLRSVFDHYDFACCQFATDGLDVYASRDAIETMFVTRVNRVDWKLLTVASRIAKYYKRYFDFAIVAPDGSVHYKLASSSEGLLQSALYPKEEKEEEEEEQHLRTIEKHKDDLMENYEELPSKWKMHIAHRRPAWILDMFLDAQSSSSPDAVVAEKPILVCCDASEPKQIDHMLETGRFSIEYARQEWAPMRMNKFIEANAPDWGDDDSRLSCMVSGFAAKMEAFLYLIENEPKCTVGPFISSSSPTETTTSSSSSPIRPYNSDPKAFCDHWGIFYLASSSDKEEEKDEVLQSAKKRPRLDVVDIVIETTMDDPSKLQLQYMHNHWGVDDNGSGKFINPRLAKVWLAVPVVPSSSLDDSSRCLHKKFAIRIDGPNVTWHRCMYPGNPDGLRSVIEFTPRPSSLSTTTTTSFDALRDTLKAVDRACLELVSACRNDFPISPARRAHMEFESNPSMHVCTDIEAARCSAYIKVSHSVKPYMHTVQGIIMDTDGREIEPTDVHDRRYRVETANLVLDYIHIHTNTNIHTCMADKVCIAPHWTVMQMIVYRES
jgi:hypothetical protein